LQYKPVQKRHPGQQVQPWRLLHLARMGWWMMLLGSWPPGHQSLPTCSHLVSQVYPTASVVSTSTQYPAQTCSDMAVEPLLLSCIRACTKQTCLTHLQQWLDFRDVPCVQAMHDCTKAEIDILRKTRESFKPYLKAKQCSP